jgi:hypothetical protein
VLARVKTVMHRSPASAWMDFEAMFPR